jgi:DNA-binding NtrC family response regulator
VEALGQSGNRKIHAAAALGISRPTLDKKIAEYKIRLKRAAV